LKIDRRTLIFGSFATAMGLHETRSPLDTLEQWTNASRKDREIARQACLDRIERMDPSIHAWVVVHSEKPTGEGRLSGIPFGAKDVMETRGLATEYGSPIYKGRIGMEDASIVHDLRQRGAVLLGKTQCAAFAYRTPPPTRNPRDLAHTPGGSSSGSAAAVAAGMVPIALGTQTLGSVLRPASYCGVTGFKPSYGLLPMNGVLPFAKSLDTLGFFTRTPADMVVLWELMGRATGHAENFAFGVPDPVPDVEPAMKAQFDKAIAHLRENDVSLRSIDISGMLAKLAEAANTVMVYEGARFHEQRFREYGSRIGDLAELVRQGLRMPFDKYGGV
jgi:Asp-tRNA(Asn)/Glu-tRNA(Gln) amidotransferase A subunit family amidase